MERKNLEKIAQTPEDKVLLAMLWDKISGGIRRDIFASTPFLSPREQELARYLFGNQPGLCAYGGYEEAERKMLCYLPEYLEQDFLYGEDSPIVCIRASFYKDSSLTHRDFLGALMGAGIARQTIGDICVADHACDFFVTQQMAPYILENFNQAGHVHLQLQAIALDQVTVSQGQTQQINDTLASLRLDSVISAGFRIGRSEAAQLVLAGRAAMDGLPCEKPDKPVSQGVKISVRGLGKIKLSQINGQSKKGRICVVIDRYV